jgi:hypothetical protein
MTADMTKLDRELCYLNATQELGMIAYVDASYGVHSNNKSHTGSVLRVEKSTVHVKSTKQKLTTKSSTETEIVGVSDSYRPPRPRSSVYPTRYRKRSDLMTS